MTGNRTINLLGLVALMVGGLSVAACGATKQAANRHTPPRRATTIGVADNGSLGRILVDAQGRTLYLFKADSGGLSACEGACATAWPPVLAHGQLSVAGGLNQSLVTTIQRPGGTHQITYHGHPLYRFVDDQKPGDVNGQGVTAFGAPWYAVTPAGSQVSASASGSGASTAPAAGFGY